ncbi:MAG: hypothetical protein V1709_08570 [Planctomycetota bacterium]
MISLTQLKNCLKRCNSALWIFTNPNSEYDIMPATIYHYDRELIAVPKKAIYEQNIYDEGGALKHRGWRSIINHLGERKLIDTDKLRRIIRKAEQGFVI